MSLVYIDPPPDVVLPGGTVLPRCFHDMTAAWCAWCLGLTCGVVRLSDDGPGADLDVLRLASRYVPAESSGHCCGCGTRFDIGEPVMATEAGTAGQECCGSAA